ncbi:MAG: NADH-quinone oxidoreductase subunit NuoF [Bacteroidia bacterium]|nr:NADH-quinone oxidoreductase subunit NuoF [Bacteroidia bacterium]
MDWRSYQKQILPDIPNLHEIEVYQQHGGYQQIQKILSNQQEWTPRKVIDYIKSANIRGRGGAGFNAGLKWSFMPPKKPGVPRYLACNGDESEPGTCKDRRIFEYNPHLFIEGVLIACYAMEMDAAYVYIRGEYYDWIKMMERAVEQAYSKGWVGKNIKGSGISIEIYVHSGAGAYICGEETSLMESLEGKRAYPRSKPPFPAQAGLWGKPTTINNIDTLACVTLAMRNGAEWFANLGAKNHPGPILYGISGHVKRPGLYEYPSGMAIKDLILEVCGGMRRGSGLETLKAVVPGGSSVPILRYAPGTLDPITKTPQDLEGVTMDTDSLRRVGTFLGTAGMLVLDDSTDMVKFLHRITRFYHHESCGQCTPCREGTGWLEKLIYQFVIGEATAKDFDLLLDLCDNIEGRTVCALADAAAWPVRNTIIRFRDEFEKRVKTTAVPVLA